LSSQLLPEDDGALMNAHIGRGISREVKMA